MEEDAVSAKHKSGRPIYYKCAILTISTSKSKYWKKDGSARDKEEEIGDLSGKIAKELVTDNGHHVEYYDVLPDDADKIFDGILNALMTDADFIITTGGTGLTKNDVTIEGVSRLLKKEIRGFGELFRSMSYEEIGTAAVLSRAIAGVSVVDQKPIFCLPGSPASVKLAITKIIMPEIAHIMKHVRE